MNSGLITKASATKVLVSIVMPCLNEYKTLPACIKKAHEAINKLDLSGEIIVADNGSTDGSQELAKSLGARVIDVPVRGYGAALSWGIQEAKGEYVVMGDADDSYDFREAVPMIKKLLQGYDLCMGTRLQGRIIPGAMPPLHQYLGNPTLSFLIRWLFSSKVSDAYCGLRAFKKEAFQELSLESTGMTFALEMVLKASLLNLRVTEVPITLHKDGRDRKPHLRTWADGWDSLKHILLFAPKFIYWVPSTIMLIIGTVLTIALNLTPGGQFVSVGNLRFNDHWIVVSVLLCLIGYELAVTGFLAYLYTLTHRLQRRVHKVDRLVRFITIEKIILFALITFSAGLALELSVVEAWFSGEFGPLNAIRPAVTGMALILISTQTLFSGFFYAVLVERYQKQLHQKSYSLRE